MADAARESLKQSLNNAVSTVGTAVQGTTEITKVAVEKATGITKTAVNAAGVLGDGAVKASEAIGSAAIATGADVAGNALKASGEITNAATQAVTDIATTALDTTASTVTVTTEKVGEALQAGVKLAGNTVTRAANGLDNIGAIVAGKGANIAKSTLQKQAAISQAIDAKDMSVKKEELLKAFAEVEALTSAALSTLHGVQKTALAGKINIYKRAKCGFFRRLTGFCDAGTISNDMKKTEFFLEDFKSSVQKATEEAKTTITSATGDTASAFQSAQITYMTAVRSAVDKFVKEYAAVTAKYDKLAREALGMSGGRRKRTYRKKKSKRARHASSRRRPSGRGSPF
jgi:hypothetical protein